MALNKGGWEKEKGKHLNSPKRYNIHLITTNSLLHKKKYGHRALNTQ
jgi:hypothetical protein